MSFLSRRTTYDHIARIALLIAERTNETVFVAHIHASRGMSQPALFVPGEVDQNILPKRTNSFAARCSSWVRQNALALAGAPYGFGVALIGEEFHVTKLRRNGDDLRWEFTIGDLPFLENPVYVCEVTA
ncbi:hypothetical protein QH494_26290 [Sphingomonas sp. AR_OL41]|uniref:hypothetical protein n=1 Tax=Sphingomonas sp. AR_OL41 TaxID=3042729 RepID=UPI0024803403|nr:hypothetical protein [Sphingomonas sp. AR_OL41]MDH7975711.1 hypothetical protein [Sphingomonas sp. AR_OL41]